MFWRNWWPAALVGILAGGATILVFGPVLANPYQAPSPTVLWIANRLIVGPNIVMMFAGGVHGSEELGIPMLLGLGALVNAAVSAIIVAALLVIIRRWRWAESRTHAA